eukprot:2164496-Alexandrium_andersonii.AAC.1
MALAAALMPRDAARSEDPTGPGGRGIGSSSAGPVRREAIAVPSPSSSCSPAPGSRIRASQRGQRDSIPGITALHTGQN